MKRFAHMSRLEATLMVVLALIGVAFLARIYLTERPWLAEAEKRIKKDFPAGISRARLLKIASAKKYFMREKDARTITIHVWTDTLKNPPQGWYELVAYDAAAMDVYLDSSDKIIGYSAAYGARVVMP